MKKFKVGLIPKVTSLADLRVRAGADPRYRELAVISSHNLGGPGGDSLDEAMGWLRTNAAETSERGVVDEVNFCRDLVRA